MAGVIRETTQAGGVSVGAYSAFSGIKAVSSAGYTILDDDGYAAIHVTTGASNRAITLPAAANNSGREITIMKADSSAGQVTITGTVDGYSNCQLGYQYDAFTVVSNGTSWYFKDGFYSSAIVSVTFSFNGTGGASSVTDNMQVMRRGNVVTLLFDSGFRATSRTGSTYLSAAAASIPSWAYPTASPLCFPYYGVRNNGASDTANVGMFQVNSDGTMYITRNLALTAYTDGTNCGINTGFSVSYHVQNG